MLKVLKVAREEYRQYYTIMTPYERSQIERDIAQKQERYQGVIESGAISEWNQAVNNLRESFQAVEAAKRNETNRWDAARLSSEMRVYEMLVNQAIGANQTRGRLDSETLVELQAIYQAAKDSNDLYKQRGCYEVLRGVLSKAPDDMDSRRELNIIAKRAAADLATLHNTPELQAAHIEAGKRVEELNAARDVLYQTAEGLGNIAPNGTMINSRFIKAFERVREDADGNLLIDTPME